STSRYDVSIRPAVWSRATRLRHPWSSVVTLSGRDQVGDVRSLARSLALSLFLAPRCPLAEPGLRFFTGRIGPVVTPPHHSALAAIQPSQMANPEESVAADAPIGASGSVFGADDFEIEFIRHVYLLIGTSRLSNSLWTTWWISVNRSWAPLESSHECGVHAP